MFASLLLSSVAMGLASTADLHSGSVEFDLHKTVKNEHDAVKAVLSGENKDSGEIVTAALVNQQVYYQVQLEIGTPGQPVDFTLDTGSSDLWAMAASNPYCTMNPLNTTGINCSGSIFNSELSDTYHPLGTPFSISYGDTTSAKGELAKDTIGIGGKTLYNATFAVANVSNATTCVFGIGFNGDEAESFVHKNGTGVYPTYFNVPTMMKQQNLIHTNAYSLWLNDINAPLGSVLFGGVDRAKYEGDLFVMPIFNNYHQYIDQPIQTRVMLSGVSINDFELADFNIAVLLDSGTSFAYLPQAIVDAMGLSLGFTYEELLTYYYGGKQTAELNAQYFGLNFSGAIINVPLNDLLVPLTLDDGTPLIIDGQEQVILAIGAAENSYMNIIGDVFLRAMYTVFDLDHYEIAVAQAKYNITESDVSIVYASIPGAVQVPNYASTSTNNSKFKTHAFTPLQPTSGFHANGTSLSTNYPSIPTATLQSVTLDLPTSPIILPTFTTPSETALSKTISTSFSTSLSPPNYNAPAPYPRAPRVPPQAWGVGPNGESWTSEEYNWWYSHEYQQKQPQQQQQQQQQQPQQNQQNQKQSPKKCRFRWLKSLLGIRN